MHSSPGRSVLDRNAAERRGAGDNQALLPGDFVRPRRPRLIAKAAEDADASGLDRPSARHPDLDAAEHGRDINDGGLRSNCGVPEINFVAPENGGDFPSAQIPLIRPAPAAAAYGPRGGSGWVGP